MSKLTVTNFSKRTGSPFQNMDKEVKEHAKITHEEVLHKTEYELKKEKQNDLMQKVSKKAAEYQAHKPSDGVFTEVVTHGAFHAKTSTKDTSPKPESRASPPKSTGNGSNVSKLLGFPSSANDLALDIKTDLESDPNISKEVKEKVIEKIFTMVSMVQHVYESKVRVMTEFEKFKDTHMRNEMRREKEHSEQLYKINMNFQNEVVQSIQRLKSELDIARNVSRTAEDSSSNVSLKDSSVDFNASEEVQIVKLGNENDDSLNIVNENESDIRENINNEK